MRSFFMLDIDLDTEKAEHVDITKLFQTWIGGTGIATKLLSESLDAIIFAIGPLSQIFPVMTKATALFKSPLTGNLGESHAGGRIALAMFESGNHVIRIVGSCKKLSYLVIENDSIQIRRAESLKNFSALSTERILREREKGIGKRSIIRIGPSGERLSPIACATVDTSRHFGRLGLGAVMGSKNLKAIIISGDREWEIQNQKEYRNVYQNIFKEVVNTDAMNKYHSLGTSSNILTLDYLHGLPTDNFERGNIEKVEDISGETLASKHLSQQISCAGCPIGCIHMATFREMFDPILNHYKTFKTSYDYELIYALGSNLGINTSDQILPLILSVEKQGWDAISIGVTLAWATEAFQKGILSETQTKGLKLNFGDAKTYIKVLEFIANQENEFFMDLEKGVLFCSQKYGGTDFAIQFCGNESPGYMTGKFAFLGYLTGVRHSHLDNAGYSIDQKIMTKKISNEEAVEEMYAEALWRMVFNSLVGCLFARKIYSKELVVQCLQVAGLVGFDSYKLEEISHRIHGLKYKYKLENGLKIDAWKIPEKLFNIKTGLDTFDRNDFYKTLELYKEKIQRDIQLKI